MRFNIVLLIFGHFVMPIVLLAGLIQPEANSQLHWLLAVTPASGYVLLIFIIGRWDWFSYYLRYMLVAFWGMTLLWSYLPVRTRPLWSSATGASWLDFGTQLLVAAFFAYFVAKALLGYRQPRNAVKAEFPLRHGTYCVIHGGSDTTINYHYKHPTQRYALDIVKLNRFGIRAAGLYPKRLDRYSIYEDSVYSPVAGTVLQAVDGRPDFTPPERDANEPAGNYAVIQPKGTNCYILIAHLQRGSVRVQAGDTVQAGQCIGRIGNSGNTTEPHLHIHCASINGPDYVRDGEGRPLLFNGRFLKRNNLVRLPGEVEATDC